MKMISGLSELSKGIFWSSPDLKVSQTPSRPSSVVKTYDKAQI